MLVIFKFLNYSSNYSCNNYYTLLIPIILTYFVCKLVINHKKNIYLICFIVRGDIEQKKEDLRVMVG